MVINYMGKNKSEFIKNLKLTKPESMEYQVNLVTEKDKIKFIKTVEKLVRASLEYRNYIEFLKENVGLDSCIFFQKITGGTNSKKRIKIEIHHEPLTLFDIVSVVLTKYQEEGLEINALDISDEVMDLHYQNLVGLVPLSRTGHEMVHNSTKVFVPLNMCYGNYSEFLRIYEPYISEDIYEKIERKLEKTANLTSDSFDALVKEFTYLDVDGFDELEKQTLSKDEIQVA